MNSYITTELFIVTLLSYLSLVVVNLFSIIIIDNVFRLSFEEKDFLVMKLLVIPLAPLLVFLPLKLKTTNATLQSFKRYYYLTTPFSVGWQLLTSVVFDTVVPALRKMFSDTLVAALETIPKVTYNTIQPVDLVSDSSPLTSLKGAIN